MKTMKDYSFYLFDADGTLIDTIELIVRCFDHTIKRFGTRAPSRQEIIKNVGLPLRNQMEIYLGPLSDDYFETVSAAHMAYQMKHYRDHLQLFPGVVEGLAMLVESGKHCAIVTSRRRNTLDLYLKETGIYDYFEAIVTPENTKRHKPDPQPVIAALGLLGAPKEDALFVGDSTFDIECASRAGVDSVFVNWSKNPASDLVVQPTFFIDDLRQLSL